MPFLLPVYVDYRRKMGLNRRLKQEFGVELDRQQLADFITFISSYAFNSLEWYGRVKLITLEDLWKSFLREMKSKGKYDSLTSPDISEVKEKGRF